MMMCCSAVSAQNLDVFHFMETNPFRHFDTPSSECIYDGYIALPSSNISVCANLGSIRYNKLFETDAEGYPVTLTAPRFVNSLAKNNYLGVNTNVEMIGFGFRVGDMYFNLDYRLRLNTDIRYSKALFGLPVYGNLAYTEKPADMNFSANMNLYQELGLSFRYKINDEMAFGLRPKLLFGAANIRANKISAELATDPTNYGLTMRYNAAIQAAAIMPYNLTFNPEQGFSFDYTMDVDQITHNMFKNVGLGLDLGFSYKPLPELDLSFGILDIGYIRWKTFTTEMSSELNEAGRFYEDGAVVFGGLNKDDIQALIDGDGLSSLMDSLASCFPLDVKPSGPYTTAVPVRVVAQADYKFGKFSTVSAAVQFRFASHYVQPSLTLAYDANFFNFVDLCVAYTLQRMSFDNLGVGIGFNLGYLNLYVGTQNIVAAISYQNASQLSASAGVVFNWGHFNKWREAHPKQTGIPQ
jgi:hypothetical protein